MVDKTKENPIYQFGRASRQSVLETLAESVTQSIEELNKFTKEIMGSYRKAEQKTIEQVGDANTYNGIIPGTVDYMKKITGTDGNKE
ncbi:MAG TPA: hypothetical protein PLX15_03965 [Candidatus Woesearchaeota archaeon]|jgi:hypothetical protein|nr:hypothetical protein [Candidatus Woesearchaeota archaeon]